MQDDLNKMITRVDALKHHVTKIHDVAWTRSSAVKAIDCILSLNRHYDRFLVPRLNGFEGRFPQITSVISLKKLIEGYDSPNDFSIDALDYNHIQRANTLKAVVDWLTMVTNGQENDAQLLQGWATDAHVMGFYALNIKGFGLAGWQYLRMLFGADTSKPDVHIIKFVEEVTCH
jgi:hypothetical protein